MGHAIAWILQDKKARSEIYIGSKNKEKKLKLPIGRITLYVSISFSGLCILSNPEELPPITKKQELISSAGGPIASLFGFILLNFLSTFITGVLGIIIYWVALISLLIFVTSFIPYSYPAFLRNIGGLRNDGLKILHLLKEIKKERKVVS